MIGYPGYHGLPEWEPAMLILENQLDFEGREFDIGDVIQIEYRNNSSSYFTNFKFNETNFFLFSILLST